MMSKYTPSIRLSPLVSRSRKFHSLSHLPMIHTSSHTPLDLQETPRELNCLTRIFCAMPSAVTLDLRLAKETLSSLTCHSLIPSNRSSSPPPLLTRFHLASIKEILSNSLKIARCLNLLSSHQCHVSTTEFIAKSRELWMLQLVARDG